MPPNTLRVRTEYVLVKSVGPKVLWVVAAETRVQGAGGYGSGYFHSFCDEAGLFPLIAKSGGRHTWENSRHFPNCWERIS
ncbi:hypothetical protein TNCV_4623141 [Trichonephila clavipes]|nr:hypothetical protein TNCV_4623141 [Trichonephila clavipes]